ncbi:MAG: MFS transporter [Paludibacteraceae bacterium]|nr:MFS transporter [Paludibacteraceae bacterium]
MKKNKTNLSFLVVMLTFFTMGFVDLVGAASNHVQLDLGLTESQTYFIPSLVFFWFLIFSVPTSALMNKIGRKNTVLVSLGVTLLSLVLPLFGNGYWLMLVAFSLLGIGNAIMQTSLNPLVTNIISGDKLASSLTFGQFVKAIASFMAPILMTWGAVKAIPAFGLDWRIVFVIYGIIGLIATVALYFTKIEEQPIEGKSAGVVECVKLLAHPMVLLCFLGIMCHVGIDVGTNTTAPKLLMERLGWTLDQAAFATSLYFIFRTLGCFSGTFILRKLSSKIFFLISSLMIVAAMVLMAIGHSQAVLYVGIALVGFGNSNIFPIIFSEALKAEPKHQNEVSGLMIMGLFGGTLFPLVMGFASDAIGVLGAVIVMVVGAGYLTFYTSKITH